MNRSGWPAPGQSARYPPPWRATDPPARQEVNGSAWPPANPGAANPGAANPGAGQLPGSPPGEPFAPMGWGIPAAAPRTGQPPVRHRTAPSPRLWLMMAAALLGVAGLAVSLVGVAAQVLPRRFNGAEQQKIMSWEVASRWRTWPAGKIFPASVSYQLPWTLFGTNSGLSLSARRIGIAPQSRCAAAVDTALARVLDRDGCEAVLRATYTDSTGSFVVTAAVAVMHDSRPAASSLPDGHGLPPGVRAVPFRSTLAARFGDHQRQISGAAGSGPYLILYTAGYADGRRRDRVASNPYASSEMKDLGTGLAHSIGQALGAHPPLPQCPGAPGC